MQELVESRRAGQDERGWVEHNAVTHARGVSVGNEAMIGPIMCDGGSEIETDASISISIVVGDEKSAAWCHGMRDKVVRLTVEAMIGGDGRVIGPSVEHV